MKLLVTGARGFIGKNLISMLYSKFSEISRDIVIYEYDIDSKPALLDEYCVDCDFVFHLAGVNRPKEQSEFMEGNYGFTSSLLNTLKKHGNTCPIMIASSVQATLDNPYGISKKAGEEILLEYGKETGARILIYRYPNIFGKWCRPNYNSVIATFCYNIANDMPIQINDRNTSLNLVYIDDVVEELLAAMEGNEHMDEMGYCYVPITYTVTLGEIADMLYSFYSSRKEKIVPDMTEGSFSKKLYATYLSYLPINQFSYPLDMNKDERGNFTEILRTTDRGQFSVNVIKPGITKGNHWHHTKNEKFVVVSGKALIQFRKIGTTEITDYHVSGEQIEVVDVPPGFTHNIINEGETDLVTFMWSSECFNPLRQDTFFEKV